MGRARNSGTANPNSVNTPTARSAVCPRRCAARTPAGIAIAAQTSKRRNARLQSCGITLKNNLPHRSLKFKRLAEIATSESAKDNGHTACRAADQVRESDATATISPGAAPSPSICSTGSPGTMWIIKKTSVSTSHSAGSVSRKRLKMARHQRSRRSRVKLCSPTESGGVGGFSLTALFRSPIIISLARRSRHDAFASSRGLRACRPFPRW